MVFMYEKTGSYWYLVRMGVSSCFVHNTLLRRPSSFLQGHTLHLSTMDQVLPENNLPRRPSTSRDRPARPPFGPRIRTRQKNSLDMTSPGGSSVDGTSSLPSATTSPTFTDPFSRPSSPGHSHTRETSFSQCAPQPTLAPSTHIEGTADAAPRASSTPPPPFSPCPGESPPAPTPTEKLPRLSPKPSVATFLPPPPLPPPPTITFESTPIPWKGLPLEAAQWTFSSAEFQEIVSKAIRLSAKESFVRLLSLQALEVDIVEETERLETERLATQAKWRFEVGRRTMLMQAINSTAAMLSSSGERDKGNILGGLVSQLATSIASCDSQLSSILQNSDHQSQITTIQHRHWASALGIALRKLNRAYERKVEELKQIQTRIQTLEDELEDAWREAEKMAVEFDVMEEEEEESEREDVFDGADEDGSEDVKQDPDDTGTLGDLTINTDLGEVLGVTATAVASKATLVISSPQVSPKQDKSDTKSVKSTRSRRSTREGPSHVSRISAARVRSRATSNASLRLPRALRTPTYASPMDTPPIPALPDSFQGQSFLEMDMGNTVNEVVRRPRKFLPMRHPEPKAALPEPPHTAGLPHTIVPSIWLEPDSGPGTRLNGLDRSHSLQIFPSLSARTPQKGRRSNLVMSLSNSDPGTSMTSPVSSSLSTPKVLHSARPGSAAATLVSNDGAPRYRSLVNKAGSVLLRRFSQATSGARHYSSSLPAYKSKEGSEGDTPPRVGSPNTG
ncbi:hypothetical protein BS17DRAFT_880160 [Gyrodon lividus]|nr:hypothetical protein BS17DRAFT_880160 [Gyrodon lividus]